MPSISNSLDAHLITITSVRATWAEVDLTLTGTPVTVTAPVDINAVLKATLSTSITLSAYLVAPGATPTSITTSLSAAIGKSSASRDLSVPIQVSIGDDALEIFFAVDLEFSSITLRLWTGAGPKIINGFEYTGTGQLLDISSIEETAEMSAKGAKLTLSGIPSVLLAIALAEPYQGRKCTIYFGVESETTDVVELFSGYMDQMNLLEDANNSTIELTIENKLVDLERPRLSRYTSAYQKSRYPGDLGLDFIEDLQDKRLVWGRNPDD